MHDVSAPVSTPPAASVPSARGLNATSPRPPRPNWETPDLTLLQMPHADAPEFPVDALPPFWRDWCRHAAEGAGVAIDYVAMSLLTAAAGLIGGKLRVSPVPAWTEPCVLWTALVGPPSSGKTSAMAAALSPVHALQDDLVAANETLRLGHLKARETARAEAWWWREDMRGAVANRRPPPDVPSAVQEPQPFAPRRLVIEYATRETVATAVHGSPLGILLVRDDLASWLAARPADRAWWLKAWSGGSRVMETRGGAAAAVACGAVSVLGTIEPEALATAVAGGEDGGLQARLLFVMPARRPLQPLSDASASVYPAAVAALGRLRELPDAPQIVPLSPEARDRFEDLRRILDVHGNRLEGADAAWWGRGASTVLRLAGVLRFLAWAAGPADEPQPLAVPADALEAAMDIWHDCLWFHARAVLTATGGSELRRRARRALRWIRQQALDELSREDVWRHARAARNAPEAGAVIDMLVAGGWLSPFDATLADAGRKRHRWIVNPRLWQVEG